jgi:KaiC/GvpD/RAD55 family RecA-like ATPase
MGESGPVREINSRGLLVRLLTYAIRCPKVARVAMVRLKPTHFDEATQLDFFMVWFVAQQLWLNGGTIPHPQHVKDLTVNLMIGEGYNDLNIHNAVIGLVDEIYAFGEDPWNAAYGIELLNAFFQGVFRRDIMRLAQQAQDRDSSLEDIVQRHQQLNVNQNVPVDPFDLSDKPALSVRNPTGATYFDLILGGGTIPSEVYGILGPSGGGKTLMALDVSCSMAERGRRVEYFSYEQPPKEIRPRLFSRAAGINIDDMKNREWDELPEAVREKITASSEKLKGNLIMHDRSSSGDSIADVINVVRESIANGRKPELVVLDWLWPLVLRIAANQAGSRRNTNERTVMQKITDDIKAIAAKYDTSILVINQLSIEMAKRRASKKPQWFNSAEAGSFAWLMHYCIAIGTQDEQGFCWLVGSKARANAKTSFVVQCLGNFNRFRLPTNSMIYDDKRKEFVDSENLNRMPGRDRPAAGSDEEDLKGGLV